jgi:hypothetical protein
MMGLAPNGLEITGTLEKLQGRGQITFCSPEEAEEQEGKLSFTWDGGTEIFWNEQKTARDENGRVIFLDREGNQWTGDEIIRIKGHCDDCAYRSSRPDCPADEIVIIDEKVVSCKNFEKE